MTDQLTIYSYYNFEDQSAILFARVTLESDYLKQVDVSSINVKSFLDDSPFTEIESQDPVVADVVSDTLVTNDKLENFSEVGYNIRFACPPTFFPNPVNYRVEMVITLTSGQVIHVVWRQLTQALYRS